MATTLFVLLGAGSACPALVVGWVQSSRQVETALQREERSAALAAHAVAREANGFLRASFQIVRALAAQVQVAGTRPEDVHPLLQVSRRQSDAIYHCYAIGPEGRSFAADPPVDVNGASNLGKDYSDRAYIQEVQRTLKPASSQPLLGRSNARPSVALAAPVIDKSGKLSAIVACGLELDALQGAVTETLALHPELRAVVVDGKQRVVVHPDAALRDSLASLEKTALYAPVAPGDPVNRTGPDEGGTDVRAVAAAVEELGWLAVVMQPQSELRAQAARIRTGVLATTSIALILCLLAAAVIARWLSAPFVRLRRVARDIGRGDLSSPAPTPGPYEPREVAELVVAINDMAARLREHSQQLQGVTGALTSAIQHMTAMGSRSRGGADETARAVERALTSTHRVVEGVREIGQSVSVLADSERLSADAIGRLSRTQGEASAAVGSVVQSVEQTSRALDGMLQSFRGVAGSIDQVSTTTQAMLASMQEMDATIGSVRTMAQDTSSLSMQVQSAAQEGVAVLGRTLQGIERIRTSSRTAAGTLRDLETRMRDIGGVVEVIDTVAHQTRLLAFNAAIIAGEAGEHGAGFAIVAEEIRHLAERTNEATGRIGDIVSGLQNGALQVIAAVHGGLADVENGVHLGQQAETALRGIHAASVRASDMTGSIATASQQQARHSGEVTQGMARIAGTMAELATTTQSHVHSGEDLQQRVRAMHDATTLVRNATGEQAQGARALNSAMARVTEMVRVLTTTQGIQAHAADEILGQVRGIREIAVRQSTAVRDLEQTIASLVRQTDVVRREVERFRA